MWTDFNSRIASSVKTIADLLEDAGVSWSVYQEDMPYSGFEGDWVNQQNGANMYVRKHKYVSRVLSYLHSANEEQSVYEL